MERQWTHCFILDSNVSRYENQMESIIHGILCVSYFYTEPSKVGKYTVDGIDLEVSGPLQKHHVERPGTDFLSCDKMLTP